MRSFAHVPLLFGVIAFIGFSSILRAEEDPFDMPPAAAKGDPVAGKTPATDKADKAGWSSSTIPVSQFDSVTFGPPGCPVVLAGTRVVEIASGKERMQVERDVTSLRIAAFSDNGQYLATGWKVTDGSGKISVYDTTTGEKVCDIPQTITTNLLLRISRNKYVIANCSDMNALDVWNLESKEKVKTIKMPTFPFVEGDTTDFSGDGKYFCCKVREGPVVGESTSGKLVVKLAMSNAPAAPKVKRIPSPARNPEGFKAALEAKLAADKAESKDVFAIAWMRAIRFAPEGDEVAAYTTHPNPRLMCWSNSGKLILDIPILDIGRSFDSSFYWLPEKTGWIVNGLLIDRVSKRPVLKFKGTPSVTALDKDHLVGRFSEKAEQIDRFTIPWSEIRESLKALDSKAPAFLAPHQPVSIEVKIVQSRGDVAQLDRLVREAVANRLQRDGVAVKEGQPATVRVTFSEQAGEQLAIYEKTSRWDFRGRDTGRKATEAHGFASVEVFATGAMEPLWRDILRSTNARSFEQEISDEVVRQSMLDQLASQLNSLGLPYFIPKEIDLLALPATVQ